LLRDPRRLLDSQSHTANIIDEARESSERVRTGLKSDANAAWQRTGRLGGI